MQTFKMWYSSNSWNGGNGMDEFVITNATASIEQKIEQLMEHYGQDILQLTYTYVHQHAIAEDLTQEIFLKCYNALPSFNGKSSMKTWLWRIAINHTKDYLKSWYNQNVQAADELILHTIDEQTSVEQTVVQHDEDAVLAKSVMQLPVIYREVIYLFYFEDYTSKEIASLLLVNENTVKTRLRKGKALLKKQLEAFQWTSN